MKNTADKSSPSLLRRKAEEVLKKRLPESDSGISNAETRKLIHELEVHQIELELQNEELMLAKNQADVENEKYTEFYNFTPSGYFTLSALGEIIDLNLCGSQMLGKDRKQLIAKRFGLFISDDTKSIFNLFLNNAFGSKAKETCEVILSVKGKLPMFVRLTGKVDEKKIQCFLEVSDISRLKEIEKELRKSEDRFKKAQEVGHTGSWEYDILKDTFWGSTEGKRIYGFTSETDIFSTEEVMRCVIERERVNKALIDLIEKNVPYNLVFDIIQHNSSEKRTIHSIAEVYRNKNGDPVKVTGVLHDITEHSKAEKELRKSEERFRHISSTISDISYSCESDPEGRYAIDWMTGAAEHITGYSIDEIKAMNCWGNLVLDEDLYLFKQHVTGLIPGSIGTCELRLVHKTGRIVWVVSFAECIEDYSREGQTVLYGGLVDITDKKQVEQELRDTKNIIEGIIDAIPVRVFWKDKDLVFLGCNKAFANDAGFSDPKEIIGKDDYQMVWREQAELYRSDDRHVIESGCAKFHIEEPQTTPEGKSITLLTSKVPLLSSTGEIRGIIGTYLDITKRKTIERELSKLNEELDLRVRQRTAELEEANKELETFSYSVSHDLHAPLRQIKVFIDLLNDDDTAIITRERLKYMEYISQSATEMEKLIDGILSFSRLNSSELQKSRVNTSLLVQQVIRFYEPEMQKRKITFNTESLPDVSADQDLLRQVWINLISNAIKYTGKKPEAIIDIGSISTEKETTFFIKDNGAGFNMKEAGKLFSVFKRFHNPKDFEGVGIGLATVERIIKRHGGHCRGEGEVGKGATIYFSLPK
jgi:PAS domain S-box-containing protein